MGSPLEGKTVAIVGAGPAGATAAYLLARDQQARVLLFDERPLTADPAPGARINQCGGCGGLVQAGAVAALRKIGLELPRQVVQEVLTGYTVHLPKPGLEFDVPTPGMVGVYRGWGPIRSKTPYESFDAFLARQAVAAGADFREEHVTEIRLGDGKGSPAAISAQQQTYSADFVIGAFGHNPSLFTRIVTSQSQAASLDSPRVNQGGVREYEFGHAFVEQRYQHKVHIATTPTPNVWFAAFVPKGPVVSIVVMGHRDIEPADIDALLAAPCVQSLLPSGNVRSYLKCACRRATLTVASPRRFLIPGEGGIALIGDAGPTRPRKNGLLAAIDLARRLADALIKGGFSGRALWGFRSYAIANYVLDDVWADTMLRLTGVAFGVPPIKSLVMRTLESATGVPILTTATREYARLILTGDAPYWYIPVGVLRRLFWPNSRAIAKSQTLPEVGPVDGHVA